MSKTIRTKPDLGEMIRVWIQHKGYLDLDTPENEIEEFYNNVKQ